MRHRSRTWEYTLGKLFSDAGYATALYGKWHVGDEQGRLPNDQGFDEWWGIPSSWDAAGYTSYALYNEIVKETLTKLNVGELLNTPPHILQGRKGEPSTTVIPLDEKIRPIVDGEYLIPKTVDFIKRQAAADKPFFVYLGYSQLHPPIIPNPEFAGKSPDRGGIYADLIAEMDYRVGQVLDAIREAGIEDNTIVVLTSDNAGDGLSGAGGGAAVRAERGAEIFSIRRLKAVCVYPRSCAVLGRYPRVWSRRRCLQPWIGCRRLRMHRISSPRIARSTASMHRNFCSARVQRRDATRICSSEPTAS